MRISLVPFMIKQSSRFALSIHGYFKLLQAVIYANEHNTYVLIINVRTLSSPLPSFSETNSVKINYGHCLFSPVGAICIIVSL